MKKRASLFVVLLAMFAMLAMVGCSGSDGAQGPAGTVDPATVDASVDAALAAKQLADLNVESCTVCHKTAGADHQAKFDAAMNTTDLTATIDSVTPVAQGTVPETYVTTVQFTLKFQGQLYDDTATLAGLSQKRYAWTRYDRATRTFNTSGNGTANSFSSLTKVSTGVYTVKATLNFDITATDAFVYMYFAKGPLGIDVGNIHLYQYVYNVGKSFGTVDYTSAVDVSGCEKCHPTPYLKHGYRGAGAVGLNDFVACKACHFKPRPGTDAAEFFGDATYVYDASVMTDTHASHALFFPYPQSMSNCTTCHPAGAKLNMTLTDANFRKEVCTSCHAEVAGNSKPLSAVVPHAIPTAECNVCHVTGGIAPVFNQIHNGYDKTKYDSTGSLRYSYFIDSIAKTGNNLTIVWGAKDKTGAAVNVMNQDATGGKPVFLATAQERNGESEGIRIMIGYDGWGSNDIANYDNMVKAAIIANTTYAAGKATTTFALTDKLTTYKADKLEIGIIGVPQVNGKMVAVRSITKGFKIADGTLFDRAPIVDPAKCDNCHSNIVIHVNDDPTAIHGHTAVGDPNSCRFCHNPAGASGHYAQQSRSIDSYLHGIHAFPTEEEFVFPMFTPLACEACHVTGKYNPPDQAKSLGGVIDNGTDDVVVGPGSMACGACHRSLNIRENGGAAADPIAVNASLNAHTETFGYRIRLALASFVNVMNAVFAKL